MTKRKGPWEGERNFIERETSEYKAGSVKHFGGGGGGVGEEIITVFRLM